MALTKLEKQQLPSDLGGGGVEWLQVNSLTYAFAPYDNADTNLVNPDFIHGNPIASNPPDGTIWLKTGSDDNELDVMTYDEAGDDWVLNSTNPITENQGFFESDNKNTGYWSENEQRFVLMNGIPKTSTLQRITVTENVADVVYQPNNSLVLVTGQDAPPDPQDPPVITNVYPIDNGTDVGELWCIEGYGFGEWVNASDNMVKVGLDGTTWIFGMTVAESKDGPLWSDTVIVVDTGGARPPARFYAGVTKDAGANYGTYFYSAKPPIMPIINSVGWENGEWIVSGINFGVSNGQVLIEDTDPPTTNVPVIKWLHDKIIIDIPDSDVGRYAQVITHDGKESEIFYLSPSDYPPYIMNVLEYEPNNNKVIFTLIGQRFGENIGNVLWNNADMSQYLIFWDNEHVSYEFPVEELPGNGCNIAVVRQDNKVSNTVVLQPRIEGEYLQDDDSIIIVGARLQNPQTKAGVYKIVVWDSYDPDIATEVTEYTYTDGGFDDWDDRMIVIGSSIGTGLAGNMPDLYLSVRITDTATGETYNSEIGTVYNR